MKTAIKSFSVKKDRILGEVADALIVKKKIAKYIPKSELAKRKVC